MSLFNLVHYDFHLGELGPLFSKAKKRHYKYYEYEINFVKQYLQLLMINRHIFILIATPLGPYIMGTKRLSDNFQSRVVPLQASDIFCHVFNIDNV